MGFNSISANPIQRDMYEREVLFVYAVIETGGKQYKVSEGDVIFVEKLAAEEGSDIAFDKVLVCGDGSNVKVGSPMLDSAKVTGKVVKNGKGKKITVLTYKPKKNEKRKMGHRQPYTKVEIVKIEA